MEPHAIMVVEDTREIIEQYYRMYGVRLNTEDIYHVVDMYSVLQGITNSIEVSLDEIINTLIKAKIIKDMDNYLTILENDGYLLMCIIDRFPVLKTITKSINKYYKDNTTYLSEIKVTDQDVVYCVREVEI